MNRDIVLMHKKRWCVPHACGDEPNSLDGALQIAVVFPTPVGMNRAIERGLLELVRVPHACGDEPPATRFGLIWRRCSPRLWG